MSNKERGEVDLKVGGKTFTLCAEMSRVAAWMGEVNIQDVQELIFRATPIISDDKKSLIKSPDLAVVYSGLKNLCVSDNADELPNTVQFGDLSAATEILLTAMNYGQDRGKEGAVEEA